MNKILTAKGDTEDFHVLHKPAPAPQPKDKGGDDSED